MTMFKKGGLLETLLGSFLGSSSSSSSSSSSNGIEDILEELVGDIWDEHDEVVEDYKEIAENTFRIDCGGNLSDFSEFFDLEIESDSITINGWIMEVLDKIPACGDRFSFENLDITVTETDYHRVSLIHVVRNEIEDEDEDEDDESGFRLRKDRQKERES